MTHVEASFAEIETFLESVFTRIIAMIQLIVRLMQS